MITYQNILTNITPDMLKGGFFQGWPNPPSPEKHLNILLNSNYVVLAMQNKDKVIGFVNALSDEILCAYIPLLEVLPEFQNKGVGSELMRRMLDILKDFYMVDLCCDESLESYYQRFSMKKSCGMIKRNYNKQQGI